MLKILKYIIAYICLICFWFIFFFLILRAFDYIEGSGGAVGLMILGTGLHFIYDKYKPIDLKELYELIKSKLA